MSSGRNFDEVLRRIDSIQLTAAYKVATPVNWNDGQDVIILASLGDAEAKDKCPARWRTVKPYLRVIAQPGRIRQAEGEVGATGIRTASIASTTRTSAIADRRALRLSDPYLSRANAFVLRSGHVRL